TEDKITALPRWPTDPRFSELERAGLAFAEKFVMDPHAISDDDAAAVTAHLSAREMVAFTEALALFDGVTRFRVILGGGGWQRPRGSLEPSRGGRTPSAAACWRTSRSCSTRSNGSTGRSGATACSTMPPRRSRASATPG